ncbi:hypothetical protein DAPPUDRAFT_325355 [Daphnia pulex]|uniref:Uncharacterized protein n=1 Tax=Daphnia pulex TaxID=6669 RepID=E9H4G9_DAPPU|nr:hypothetical protein DAPPUDRAFT_325355 [Daphnia pulex]|eukprot:EFX73377.1 hypothetical protein DAPPUDRAFT_325355 [Daphnia pulex]
MKILKSKTKRLLNASQNKTNEQSHSSKRSTPGRKKKRKHRVSKSHRFANWIIKDRVLNESPKESLLSQDKTSLTFNFAQLPTVETETATEEIACNEKEKKVDVKSEKARLENGKTKRLRNASQNKTNEQSHSSKRSTPGRKKKSEHRVLKEYRWEFLLVDRGLKESLKESPLSQDKLSSTFNFAQLPTVETETATEEIACNEKEKKVDVKSKKAGLENATKNETNQQPASDSRSSRRKKKSEPGVSESSDWQLALVDRVLKEIECAESSALSVHYP